MPLVEIVYDNSLARMRSKDEWVFEEVDRLLSFYPKGYRFMPRFKKGKWDGRICFMHADGSFPAGFVNRVRKFLSIRYEVKVYDQRIAPEDHPKLRNAALTVDLRDSQDEAADAGIQATRGIFEAATGWGKTRLMSEMIRRTAVPSLVLFHRNELVRQTAKVFQENLQFPHKDQTIGMIGGGIWEPGLITCASFQTLVEMLRRDKKGTIEWLRQFPGLHVDEAHHIPAKTLRDLVEGTRAAFWRFGYSATAFKSDKGSELRVVEWIGEIIYKFPVAKAVEEGINSDAHVYMFNGDFPDIPGHDPEGRYTDHWSHEYRDGITEHKARNHVYARFAEEAGRRGIPTLVLVQHLEQGRELLRFIEDGLAEFVHGSHDSATRDSALSRLNDGTLPILIASSIFDEGIDLPAIGALAIAGGYNARHKLLQRLGRGLRTSPGKRWVTTLDSWDNHAQHLEAHARRRYNTYRKVGFKPIIVKPDDLYDLMATDDFWGMG